MYNLILFAAAVLIWGSTWLAIKFQLGVVDPLVSIFYRFIIAAVILLVFSKIKKLNLRFSLKQHLLMAMLGTFLFGINYWLVYLAELQLTSGLVAVVFSTIIFLNIFNGAIFLKVPIRLQVFFSALLGFLGISLVFKDELLHFSFSSGNSKAFLIALLGSFTASLGNITSAHMQKNKIPVIQANAFGMLYGSLLMLFLALITFKPITFEATIPYVLSLSYLSVFGSVIAFGSYLSLLGRIGPDKAAYATLVIPVIALILSTIFEDYQWTWISMLGVLIVLIGNVLILRKKKATS